MSYSSNNQNSIFVVISIVIGIVLVVFFLFFGLPMWNVWRAGLAGESELKQAEWNRQISIQEAKAKHAAAEELAKAEVARAHGVAEANKIIGESLKGNDAYLRYLWIQNLESAKNGQVIYVPTEAGLPILEASRLGNADNARK